MEHLDRAYVIVSWMDHYPNQNVYHKPIVVSDRAVIIYATNNLQHTNRHPYQVEKLCLLIQEVITIIHNQ